MLAQRQTRRNTMKTAWNIALAGAAGLTLGAAGMAAYAAQTAPPMAYYVGNVQEVKDPEAYRAYAGSVAGAIAPFGGKFIVRGAEPVILDASKKPPGYIVVIQFPSMKSLRDWWDSPAYAAIRPTRERLTTGQNYAVEGVPPS
uniref:DUF1330 domain-containing protein n=1 Tax=uncultured bacterium BLR7 TaxID=506523 RepID=C0INN6_9BACT|nr:protein of unknown function DUF1330 [uncultured bacterium BLR7]